MQKLIGVLTINNCPSSRRNQSIIYSNSKWLVCSNCYKKTYNDTSACVNIIKVGISPIVSQNAQVIIYPNPNNGAFTMSATSEGVYIIQNGLGQTMQTVQLNAVNNYTVNIENLSNGIYIVTGYNNKIITQQKVVVSK